MMDTPDGASHLLVLLQDTLSYRLEGWNVTRLKLLNLL